MALAFFPVDDMQKVFWIFQDNLPEGTSTDQHEGNLSKPP